MQFDSTQKPSQIMLMIIFFIWRQCF